MQHIGKPKAVAANAAYKTPAIAKYLFDAGILPALPYTPQHTKEGFFKKSDYVYDEYYDCYLCPAGEILSYSTTNKEGYWEYKSTPAICNGCDWLSSCTASQAKQKVVTRLFGNLL